MHGSYWLIFTFQRATAIITPNRHFNFFFFSFLLLFCLKELRKVVFKWKECDIFQTQPRGVILEVLLYTFMTSKYGVLSVYSKWLCVV